MEKILFNNLDSNNIKTKLLEIIINTIDTHGWNQTTAAQFLNIDQPKISQMRNGKVAGFSLGRLLLFLVKLNCKVELVITQKEIDK